MKPNQPNPHTIIVNHYSGAVTQRFIPPKIFPVTVITVVSIIDSALNTDALPIVKIGTV
jgi:hypothetical protein